MSELQEDDHAGLADMTELGALGPGKAMAPEEGVGYHDQFIGI